MNNIVSLIGRPGCGKGTQAERLVEETGWEPIYTGKLLRKRAKEDDYIANKIEEAISEGRLIPTPLVFQIWMPKLMEFREDGTVEGVIFDGNPRKMYEAKMLDEVFELFEWKKFFTPIHLKISEEEARRRLLKRGRQDDNKKEIERRLGWFETEVRPVLDYYEDQGSLIVIDGEQSIEKVYKDLKETLDLDET